MHSRIDRDPQGRQYLIREGSGWVTAVVPTDPALEAFRVEILCRLPQHWSAALRTTVTAVVPAGHPLMAQVRAHEVSGTEVAWAMEWHRHDGVPDSVPIASLDLATDASSRLTDVYAVEGVRVESIEARGAQHDG